MGALIISEAAPLHLKLQVAGSDLLFLHTEGSQIFLQFAGSHLPSLHFATGQFTAELFSAEQAGIFDPVKPGHPAAVVTPLHGF